MNLQNGLVSNIPENIYMEAPDGLMPPDANIWNGGASGPDLQADLRKEAEDSDKVTMGTDLVPVTEYFRSYPCAPYSLGARVLWLQLLEDGDSGAFSSLILVKILIDLEQFRARAEQQSASEEEQYKIAVTALLKKYASKSVARAEILLWVSDSWPSHEVAILHEAIAFVDAVLSKAEANKPASKPGETGAVLGK